MSGGTEKNTVKTGYVHRINRERCKGCGLCVMVCPREVLVLSDELNARGYHPAIQVLPQKCIHCALCCRMCPDTAITIESMSDDHGKDN